MSTGFGGKGKDGKYNTLNLASYKGSRSAESKSSGSIYRHGGGYQSLGKVACTRRVPPPASIPSLKSENLGNDPNINLVPKDGSGWGSKTETSSVQSQELLQQPASTSFSQQATCPSNSMNINNRNPKWTQPTTGPQAQQHTWVSRHAQNGKKMCEVVGGVPARGTTHSSEDFPILGGSQKDGNGTNIKNKDPGYTFGTNLRPQNFSSWKGGGGKNFPHLKDENNCDEYHRNYQSTEIGEKHDSAVHENKSELRSDESSWLVMHNEVDYGEKLVFSEDDEVSTKEDPITIYTMKESVYEQKNTDEDISMSKPDPYHSWSSQPRLSPRLPPHRQSTCDETSLHSSHQQVTDLISNLSISSESRYSDSQNDENKIKKSEKEEAIERARKRREQEEMRMLQMKRHKSISTPDSYDTSKCRKWFGGNSATFTRQRHDNDVNNRLPGDGCGIPNSNNEDNSSHNYSRQYRDKSSQDLSYDRSSPNSLNTRLGLQLNNGPVISNIKLHSREYDYDSVDDDSTSKTSFENSKLTNLSTQNPQEIYSRSTSTDSTQAITSYTNNRSHSIIQNQESNDERLIPSKPTTQQPLPSRRLDKVKLRNFRVDDDDDGDSVNFNFKIPSSKTDGQLSKEAGESASTEKKPWNNIQNQQVNEKRKQHTRSLFANKDNYQAASRYFEKDEKGESVTDKVISKESSAAIETTDDTSASIEDQHKSLYRNNDFKRNQRDNYNSRASKRSSTANNNHKPDYETRNSSNRNSRINKTENRNSRVKPARNDARNEEPRDVRSTEPRRREPKKGFERYESKARHNRKETKMETRALPIHKPLTRDEDSDGDVYEPVEPFPLMQTPAAPPSTNVWEERAKKHQLQQKEDLPPPTFIPTVEDKKRTLKETAPVKKSEKPRIDSNKRHPSKQLETTSRASSSPPPLQSKRRDGNYSSYDERRKGRGSRSRGTYTSNRGAGNHGNESSAPSRGRGRRGSRSSASYKTPAPSFGNNDRAQWPRRHLPDETPKDHVTDDALLSDSNDTEAGRRRQLGEISDGEVASSAISLSENEDQVTVSIENQPRQMNGTKLTRNNKQSHTGRGAPSRRGRGTFNRGHHNNRPRGGGTRSDVTIPPLMSSHIGKKSNFRSDHKELTGGRPSKTYGRSYADDSEKRTAESRRKQQRPPRFDSNEHQEGGSRRTRRHGNRVYDVNNEDWESESDRSGAEQKRHRHALPDRVDDVTNGQRSESRRHGGGGGRGRRNGSNRRSGQQQTTFKRNVSSQVYMLHTVKYNDPSAIAGAMAGSGSNKSGELNKKSPNDIKERKKDLFQKYDLHNYAGVVNVDDIPEITDQNDQLIDELDKTSNSVQSGNINCENVSGEDDDGFTPVLSKRKQKKLQEEKKKETLLKQEKTLAVLEGLRKFPNRSNRRTTSKPTTNTLSTGSSGSVRQASPSSQTVGKQQAKEVWDSKIVSWNPVKDIPPMVQVVKEKKFEKSISQHDSGVESSIPSSQRSSPGTDTKLTFNQLANPVTTTTAASVTSKPIEQTVQSSTVTSIKEPSTSDLKQFHDKDSSFQSTTNPNQVNTSLNDTSSINRIVPIGNERGKCPVTKLPSRSVENIVSMFPYTNTSSKLITLMPEASDEQKDLYCPSENLEKTTEDSKPTDLQTDLTKTQQRSHPATVSSISFIENEPFISISQPVLQSEFGVSKSTSDMVVNDQGWVEFSANLFILCRMIKSVTLASKLLQKKLLPQLPTI